MITCPNCGAEIEENVSKCPYCGYINIEGARAQHFKDIDDIRTDISETKKEPVKALKKGLSKGVKTILVTAIILLLLVTFFFVILLIELQNHPKEFRTAEEEVYASAYREVAGEQLAGAFEKKDIAQMAGIFDKAYYEDRVSLWGEQYYEAGYASSCYMKLQECLPDLDNGKLTKRKAEPITYYCFYFYYRAYGDEGAEIFDPIRENEILPIIHNRLGFTDEDMENFRGKVTVPTGVVRSNVYSIVKKNYKKFR